MAAVKDELIAAITAQDNARPRTQQVEIGASQLGGCRRAVAYKMLGTTPINLDTKRLAAAMGTAIHAMIEDAFTAYGGDDYLLETAVPGVPEAGLTGDAHVDCYRFSDRSVTDWKTTSKKNQRYFPAQKQIWQVQVYGYCMTRAGYDVEIVRLVSIARDGNEDDIVVHEEPYDEDTAIRALDWLYAVKTTVEAGELPPPDLSGPICTDYCPFYHPTAEGYCPSALT